MPYWSVPVAALVVAIGILAWLSIKVVPQYERGVVFRLGRLRPLYDPGLHLLIPGVDRMQRVDTRIVTLTM